MIRILAFLVLVGLTASGFALIADLDGGVAVTLGPYQMDLSVMGGMVGLAALCAMLLLIWSILSFVWNIPHRVQTLMQARKTHKGQEALTKGLIGVEFLEQLRRQ